MEKYKIEALIRMYKDSVDMAKRIMDGFKDNPEDSLYQHQRGKFRVYTEVIKDLETLLSEDV